MAVVGNTVTGGEVIASGYSDATNQTGAQSVRDLPSWYLGASIAGTPYELIFAVQKLNGAADTFIASMTWLEYI
jgi:hypothetical protein